MAYNYFFNWAITIAIDLSAAAMLMQYWWPHSSFGLWCGVFFTIILGFNLLAVRLYGESEYIISLIKVIAVIIFIIMGVLLITGTIGDHAVGLRNWSLTQYGLHGGFSAIIATFIVAGFSFQGTEILGITAGESSDPATAIPRATKQVFWRILLFYICAMAIIGCIIPYTDPRLIHADTQHLAMSPFTIVFSMVGLHHAASLLNFVILIAVLSAANSGMYSSSRMLWYMSKQGTIPKAIAGTTDSGVPVIAVCITAVFAAAVFMSSIFGSGVVFFWLLNISSLAGFIAWIGIALSHYKFRRQFIKTGHELTELPYRSRLYPFAPLFCLVMTILIIIGQGYLLIIDGKLSWENLSATYISIPILFILWVFFKFRTNQTATV